MFDEIVGQFEACKASLESDDLNQATARLRQLGLQIRQYFDSGQQPSNQAQYTQFEGIVAFLNQQTTIRLDESKDVLAELSKLNKGKSMVKAYGAHTR